ncbi:ABC transporter permease [Azospirillum cavernae]|uniref:ABC transporter permease n=1 Tax=Azospirillum cavernae TaxID=2320860 RepID=A0A418VUM4_9PROT|nr:ABC transporter permease [Azospirillum cavernae]RJF80857.1 ABC transporter permease [Azospirillum cavernae]
MDRIMNALAALLTALVVPGAALLASLALFGAFVALVGVNPLEVYELMYRGAFGSWFSWQNTLTRAAPLILTALCTALPAQLGLVIIGGEGALVLGGLAAAATGVALDGAPVALVMGAMGLAGMAAGAALIGGVGALRHRRGVNETISSLLLTYIAIAVMNHMVEGPLKDPASLNKPSTAPLAEAYQIGPLPGMDVHWGLVLGVLCAVAAWVLMSRTVFGFAARMVGGNPRAARMAGLPVGRLLIVTTALAGAAAGLAGMVEVAAVHGRANAALVAGYGSTGVLVAFLARQNPLAVIPVAILFGGIGASGGLLQRRLGLPDASVLVFQGIIFVVLLASEAMQGRVRLFAPAPILPAAAKEA